jgi:hypothetical protein
VQSENATEPEVDRHAEVVDAVEGERALPSHGLITVTLAEMTALKARLLFQSLRHGSQRQSRAAQNGGVARG